MKPLIRRIVLDAAPDLYLLRDLFTTSRAAGAINGTLAEPGGTGTTAQKTRTVVDTESKEIITGKELWFKSAKTTPTFGDPGLWYGAQTRAAGKTLVMYVLGTKVGNAEFAWAAGQSGAPYNAHSIYNSSGDVVLYDNSVTRNTVIGSAADMIPRWLAIVLRATGADYYVKLTPTGNWIKLYRGNVLNTGTLYPGLIHDDKTNRIGVVAIPKALWLSTPLISDGFSVLETTDGLGNAEGIAGGLGIGGGGLTWADLGTWSVTGGVCTPAVTSGGMARRLITLATPDVNLCAKVIVGTGEKRLIVRYVDNDNLVFAEYDGTNARLVKRLAGTETNVVAPMAVAATDGSYFWINCYGNNFTVHYKTTRIGNRVTITDAALQTGAVCGIASMSADGSFDDFTAEAAGTSGEYNAALNAIIPACSQLNVLPFGDSKTVGSWDTYGTTGYPKMLRFAQVWFNESPTRIATSGWTTANAKDAIDAALAAASGTPVYILWALGANDIGADEATWKANAQYIIDAFHTKWTSAIIIFSKVWYRTHDAECTTINGWFSDLVASNPGVCRIGPDEYTCWENGDAGATYMANDAHPNSLGYQVWADAWRLAMGY